MWGLFQLWFAKLLAKLIWKKNGRGWLEDWWFHGDLMNGSQAWWDIWVHSDLNSLSLSHLCLLLLSLFSGKFFPGGKYCRQSLNILKVLNLREMEGIFFHGSSTRKTPVSLPWVPCVFLSNYSEEDRKNTLIGQDKVLQPTLKLEDRTVSTFWQHRDWAELLGNKGEVVHKRKRVCTDKCLSKNTFKSWVCF